MCLPEPTGLSADVKENTMRLEDYNSKVFTQITENFTVHRRIIYVLLAMCLILLSAIVTNRVTINGQSHRLDRHTSSCDREHESHIEYHVIMGDSLILEWDNRRPAIDYAHKNLQLRMFIVEDWLSDFCHWHTDMEQVPDSIAQQSYPYIMPVFPDKHDCCDSVRAVMP